MISVWRETEEIGAAVGTEYSLAPHVSLVIAEDGTARLLDMSGAFFALPVIGAEMLVGILERGTVATALDVARRHEVDVARVRADLDVLLQQLRGRGLLRKGGRRESGPGLARILSPCLALIRSGSSGRTRTLLVLTLAKLSLLVFGWARTMAAWQAHLGRLASGGTPPDEPAVRAIDRAVRELASRHPLPMACKERALACWTLLRWDGLETALVVGLEFFPLIGHCWCEAGPWVLSDYADHCEFYTPVLRYA